MLEHFSNRSLQQFLTLTNAIASRMRWRQLELNSIANPKMSIGITHLTKQELEPSA